MVSRGVRQALAAMLLAGALGGYLAIVWARFPGWVIQIGALQYATPGYLFTAGWWALLGSLAVAGATILGLEWARPAGRVARMEAAWRRDGDPSWIAALCLIGLAGGLLVRGLLLDGAALTDDEASYRFAAELLASGRLFVESPPMKLHFDHAFLINDGRLQTLYFLGWPALQAPFVLAGAPGAANAFYFALGIPAVFLAARCHLGTAWARLVGLLYATSPFLLVLAATELSHTTCLTALGWAYLAWLRSRAVECGSSTHALFAACLSIAFFIRPISAVGVGGPLALLWLRDRLARRKGALAAGLAFAAPALLFATLFLGAQRELHGSPWKTGYAHGREYHRENGFRFTPWFPPPPGDVPGFEFRRPIEAAAKTANGLLRLGFDLTGWPIGLLLLVPALRARGSSSAWAVFAGGLAAVFFQKDPGIDTFGPVHFAELALPVYLLFGFAAARWSDGAGALGARFRRSEQRRVLAPIVLLGLALVAAPGFVFVRWNTLAVVARSIRAPERLAAQAIEPPGVVFASFPYLPCPPWPARSFRHLRPGNDPDLSNPILWVNHVDVASDRELLRHFPGRSGYLMLWDPACRLAFIPIERPELDSVPPGRQTFFR